MVRLLLTHGRGLHGRDKDRLRAKFTRYLREGLETVGYQGLDDNEIDFLYYGDLLERPVSDPAVSPLVAAGQAAGGTGASGSAFDDELESLRRHLDTVATADARVCTLVEERASREPSVADDADPDHRHAAVDAAIEERTTQLLENPAELLDVLEQQFGPDYGDDERVRGRLHELDDRLGDNPREVAAHRASEDGHTDDPGRVDTLLKEWIVDPATDAIASMRAISRVIHEHGVDLRARLGEWGQTTWSEMLTRFEGTDFGRQWATLFDIIAVVANVSMLDGFYIARRMADVENYLTEGAARDDVRAYFRDALHGREIPTIMVANSLGSVIAYDVMREYPNLDVPGLVTLGSPLSIGHFRRNLAREGESGNNLPVPEMLQEWINVYSEMDPLTLGSGIAQYFQGGGDEAGRGPVDREAENTGYLDAHSPDQYLRAKATSNAVIQMIAEATARPGVT